MSTKPELFLLEEGDALILYAPLRRLLARINAGARTAVRKELEGLTLNAEEQVAVDTLRARGFFDEVPVPVIPETFEPATVTLFPTDACNLRCRYCYAAAEEGAHKLPMEAARAAIDLVAENALRQKRPHFQVGFHGNGEPFMAFDIIRECCEYTVFKAEQLGLRGNINSATNGVLSDKQLDFVLAWFNGVNISSDILPDLQNRQRPFPDGSGSFDRVDYTIRRIDDAGLNYGIRATLTDQCAHRLVEMADYVTEHYPHCNQVHLEPAWEVGRALNTGEKSPVAEVFVEQYLKAVDKLGNKGVKLVYSGARQDALTASFCSVCRGSFTVSAEAKVTACYEVCTADDPRSERFLFGEYDFEKKGYVFDREKMDALAGLNVHNMPFCRDCFCKWHCAGDCAAKLLGEQPPQAHAGSTRCQINRALTKKQILRKMQYEEGVAAHV